MREVSVDTPVSHLVCVGQCVARNLSTYSHVIEFLLRYAQAGFDIAQALPVGKLREGHAKKLVPAGKGLDFVIASIKFDALAKLSLRNKVREL